MEASTGRPRVGVAVMVTDGEGRLLLGRRGKEPNYGKWVVPGGGIEFGESWHQTATRELREETGLAIRIGEERPFVLELLGNSEHRIILFIAATAVGGRLRAGSDLLEVRFFTKKELTTLDVSPAVVPALSAFGWA